MRTCSSLLRFLGVSGVLPAVLGQPSTTEFRGSPGWYWGLFLGRQSYAYASPMSIISCVWDLFPCSTNHLFIPSPSPQSTAAAGVAGSRRRRRSAANPAQGPRCPPQSFNTPQSIRFSVPNRTVTGASVRRIRRHGPGRFPGTTGSTEGTEDVSPRADRRPSYRPPRLPWESKTKNRMVFRGTESGNFLYSSQSKYSRTGLLGASNGTGRSHLTSGRSRDRKSIGRAVWAFGGDRHTNLPIVDPPKELRS